MMGNYYGMMGGGWFAGWGFVGILTWLLLVIFLILGIMYFWQEIQKKK